MRRCGVVDRYIRRVSDSGIFDQTLTLFAMVLAIGLVVDDAIVVVEAVEFHMRFNGLPPREATYKAMEDVSAPIVAIAFVLASVFIPVAFFGGTVGVLYKQFALTIAVSTAISAIVALSLTPALCALLLKPHDPNAHTGKLGHYLSRFTDWFEGMRERYERGAVKVLFRAKFSLFLMPLLLVFAWGISSFVPSSFVPSEDQGYFVTTVSLPEAASMKRTEEVSNKIAEEIRKQPGVKQTMIVAGIDMLAGANKSVQQLFFVELTPWKERTSANSSVDNIVRSVIGMASRYQRPITMAFKILHCLVLEVLAVQHYPAGPRRLRSRTGRDDKSFLAEARKRPDIAISNPLSGRYSRLKFYVEREKAQKLGVP